ncbi:MAG: hypothetical protein A2Z25_10715 [Planctomycetes bacterium RBG_16_55_9]|nr:MAG: hypothetical protein A2Z25_10715 [Planctomycetes bacterium RBG_16_55_9]
MKWLNGYKMRLVIVGFVAVLMLGGGSAKADFTFGKPQNLGPTVNSLYHDAGPSLSADGLDLYFYSDRPGGSGGYDIWVSTRQGVEDPWGLPANLGAPVNSQYNECYPSLSSDGLTLYFSDYYSGSPRPGGLSAGDIWMTTRPSRSAPWGTPVNMGAPINGSTLDMSPTISGDCLTLIFTSNNRAGGRGSWDLWMSTRAGVQDPWGPPMNLGSTVNSGGWDGEGGLSWDGRAVFFDSGRAGIVGTVDLWMSTRKTIADPWAVAVNLGSVVNSSGNDGTARVSPDMRTLYFCSDRPGGFGSYDLYTAPILPIVDFNGDGIVDGADVSIMVDYWRTDNSICDIGPPPWGDGIVDVQDLIVLAEHLFEEPGLIAHWTLDETERDIAHDSASGYHGTVHGTPAWQPDGGMLDGALQFDGIDDYVSTEFVLNPSDGVFSVVAWIKGGEPGQAFLSQADSANWLCTDSIEGCLMTEVKAAGRGGVPLLSQTVITDDTWHRIGFVWDGSYRHLYVDGVEVAKDAAPLSRLEDAHGGLYFGAGSTLAPDTFWSGLIDDIRIYNRAVSP